MIYNYLGFRYACKIIFPFFLLCARRAVAFSSSVFARCRPPVAIVSSSPRSRSFVLPPFAFAETLQPLLVTVRHTVQLNLSSRCCSSRSLSPRAATARLVGWFQIWFQYRPVTGSLPTVGLLQVHGCREGLGSVESRCL